MDQQTTTSFERVDSDGIMKNASEQNDQQKSESHTRSLIKGITWRMVATLTTVIVSWLVVGDVSAALQIGFFECIIKIGIYYLHERLWLCVRI